MNLMIFFINLNKILTEIKGYTNTRAHHLWIVFLKVKRRCPYTCIHMILSTMQINSEVKIVVKNGKTFVHKKAVKPGYHAEDFPYNGFFFIIINLIFV